MYPFNEFRQNEFYYIYYFNYPGVKEEALENFNIELSLDLLNLLSINELGLYIEYREVDTIDVIRSGYSNLFFNLIELEGLPDESLLDAAIEGGNPDIFKYLLDNEPLYDEQLDKIVEEDKLSLVKELDDIGVEFEYKHMLIAAKKGYKDMVEFLFGKVQIDSNIIAYAAQHNQLDIVKFLYKEGAPVDNRVISFAVEGNAINVLEYLLDRITANKDAITIAARNGNEEIVKLLLDYKAPINPTSLIEAAEKGYLNIVKLLVKARTPIIANAVNMAIANQHKDIAKYLIEEGGKTDHMTILYAKREGYNDLLDKIYIEQLSRLEEDEIVQFVEDYDITINEDFMLNMLEMGYTKVALALFKAGYEPPYMALALATKYEDVELIHYLLGHSSTESWKVAPALLFAIENEDDELAKILIDRSDSLRKSAKLIAQKGNLNLMRYLVEEKGFEINEEVIQMAIANEHLPIVKYIFEDLEIPGESRYLVYTRGNRTSEIRDYLINEVGIPITNQVRLLM